MISSSLGIVLTVLPCLQHLQDLNNSTEDGQRRTVDPLWVLCKLYHALRQQTRLGTARPVSTPLSVEIVKKVGGPKAEQPCTCMLKLPKPVKAILRSY